MRVAKEDVDVRIDIPGVNIRQRLNFGDATGLGKISGEVITLAAGVDTTPVFKGLEGDQCQCPHWGYVVKGEVTTTDAAGHQETLRASDLFYWPGGHNVKALQDTELVLFSPQDKHTEVLDFMKRKIATAAKS